MAAEFGVPQWSLAALGIDVKLRDARDHGVEVRPVRVNASRWDWTLELADIEDRFAVRLGLRLVRGLANSHGATLVGARANRSFVSVDDLWRRAGVPVAAICWSVRVTSDFGCTAVAIYSLRIFSVFDRRRRGAQDQSLTIGAP
jgi:hypothetical protein